MTHDLVIRGGSIVDGIGGEPTRGDMAVDAGRITAIGNIAEKGNQEFDAGGMMETVEDIPRETIMAGGRGEGDDSIHQRRAWA